MFLKLATAGLESAMTNPSRIGLAVGGIEAGGLGFGAAGIGNLYREVEDSVAARTVDAAWASGVRYFDTAPHYGLGLSEARLGAALSIPAFR